MPTLDEAAEPMEGTTVQNRQEISDLPKDAIRLWPEFAEHAGLGYAAALELARKYQIPIVEIAGEAFLMKSDIRVAVDRLRKILDEARAFIAEIEA